MKSNLVDIACTIVHDKPEKKAIAIVDGTEIVERDKGTSEETVKLKWFWLPRSQTEINDDNTVTIPEWLAQEKGLI